MLSSRCRNHGTERDRFACHKRSSSVDCLPMTCRTPLLITAILLCHQLLAPALVTSQLLSENSDHAAGPAAQESGPKNTDPAASSPCARQAALEGTDSPLICAIEQEKDGSVYKLHGNAEIYYRDYILRADEVTYNSDSGEASAAGHFTLDGGPNDDHIVVLVRQSGCHSVAIAQNTLRPGRRHLASPDQEKAVPSALPGTRSESG